MIKQDNIYDNKFWFWRKGKGTHTCCDCGAVHDVIMQVTKDKKIRTKWTKNKKETSAERRKIKRMKKKKKPPKY